MKWIWRLCYTDMKRRGVRTWLTIFGVVIGVISVVSLVSIGIGLKNTVLEDFAQNDNLRKIKVTGVMEGKRKDRMITDRKILEFEDIEHVEAAYPCLDADGIILYENYTGYGMIVGVPRTYLETLKPIYGSLPEEQSVKPQLLMGQGAAYMFYNENSGVSLTETMDEEELKTIDLTGKRLQIQFGYQEDAWKDKLFITGMLGNRFYESYCDIDILKRYLKKISPEGKLFGQPVNENGENDKEWIYSSGIILVDETENVDDVIKKLQKMGFSVENDKEELDMLQKSIRIIQLLLGCVGMIALIVAVIGIGNTMTTSVYDRLHEIGILKMLGCDIDDLVCLFLLESGILGGLGGFIGILCSYGMVQLLINPLGVKLLDLEKGTQIAQLPLWLMLGAFLFSVLLGLLAGFLPAKWAAGLRPMDAVGRN